MAFRTQSSSVVTERAIPTRSSAGYRVNTVSRESSLRETLQLPVSGLKRQVLLTYIGFKRKADTISKVTEPWYEY